MTLQLFLMRAIVLVSLGLLMSCGGGGSGGSKGDTFDIRSSAPPVTSSNSSLSVSINSSSSLSSNSQSAESQSSAPQSALSKSSLSSNRFSSVSSSVGSSSTSSSSHLSSLSVSTLSSSNAAITLLPVEVMGDVGLIEPASISMTGNPSAASYLWLKTHNLTWREDGEFAMKFNGSVRPGSKGSVRLNGGPWVPLMNANTAITCEAHEAKFGCLNGTYMTVRIRVAIDALGSPGLTLGKNTLEFRFDATDGVSSGWRVLAMDVRDSNGATLIANNFAEDNPDNWEPPLSSPADIAAGDELWSNGALTDKNRAINGKCASCHEREAYDLKYFNYSNKSIVARSVFHGLTELQGRQIASYVRSLDSRLPEGITISQAGRPWNPPFQPGPGLDSKPVELWSAGAGIDAVLENDSMMKEYMFPGGTYSAAKLGASGFLNPRETPQALQFPDWNTWLPTIALEDMVSDPTKLVPFTGDTPPAENQQNPLDMLKLTLQWLDSFRDTNMETDDWYLHHGLFTLSRWASSRWGGNHAGFPGEVWPSDALGNSRQALARYGWYNVRLWEIMKKYRLEELTHRSDLNTTQDGLGKRGIPAGFRSWSMPLRTVFETAPHFVGPNTNIDASYGSNFVFSKPGEYLTTAWYSLEQVINGGWRSGSAGIDWNYHPQHLGGMHHGGTGFYNDGPMHIYRWTWSIIWLYQTRPTDWVPSTMGGATSGFMQRQIGLGLEIPFMDEAEAAGEITLADRKQLQEAMALAFLGVVERYTPDQWMRRTVDDDASRTSSNFETVDYVANYNPAWAYDLPERGYQADAYYLRIKTLKDRGYLTDSTLNRLVDWGVSIWPKGNWQVLRP